MTKPGWLTKQFDSAKKDVEQLPRWLQEKPSDSNREKTSDNQVIQLREGKIAEPRSLK